MSLLINQSKRHICKGQGLTPVQSIHMQGISMSSQFPACRTKRKPHIINPTSKLQDSQLDTYLPTYLFPAPSDLRSKQHPSPAAITIFGMRHATSPPRSDTSGLLDPATRPSSSAMSLPVPPLSPRRFVLPLLTTAASTTTTTTAGMASTALPHDLPPARRADR